MNKPLATRISRTQGKIILLLLVITLACSKDSSAPPIVGCKFTFKGTSYSFSVATCQTVGGLPALQSNSASQQLTMFQGNTPGSSSPSSITFDINTNDPSTFYYSSGAAPTVNVSGKTWTFNGVLLNNAADSGTILGTCNCTN